jgi:enoyl-CoA hydratase
MPGADVIDTTRDGAVAILTINRPKVLNALDIPTLLELRASLDCAERDPEIRVIVLTGAGDRAFVAGGDIGDLESRRGLAHYQEFAEVIHRVFSDFERCDKPTIAAINGWALGGGTELTLSLDIRIAADSARFGLPEINLGIFPGAGGTQRIVRQLPPCRARELVFTGDQFSATEAVQWGLINRVVPAAELMASALDTARKIAGKSPLALRLIKRVMRLGADMPMEGALAYEQAMIGLSLDSDDAHEGCRAFLEKRAPSFQGR